MFVKIIGMTKITETTDKKLEDYIPPQPKSNVCFGFCTTRYSKPVRCPCCNLWRWNLHDPFQYNSIAVCAYCFEEVRKTGSFEEAMKKKDLIRLASLQFNCISKNNGILREISNRHN